MTSLATRTRTDWERLIAPLRPEGRAFIDGKFVAARDGRVFEKKSPIDGRVIAQVAAVLGGRRRCGHGRRACFEAGVWRRTEPKRAQARAAALCRADPR